ncbi:hypothetical protein [Silvanigrella aquatica]|uniref:Uncharacterized protein n=1 Tax=Silvanigrella aquatica TaxID=1915309 RepID=A0A1L4D006_9BACT|nr:hypothetical protein [Silvanigrella aquatica]APJ03536.1 hypothetical protein AXG55_06300 [Silvanigrella aquatica]
MERKFYIILIFILNIIFCIKLYAREKTYIICTNIYKHWYWLKDDNDEYVEVSGTWSIWNKSKKNSKYSMEFSFKYFLLENSYELFPVLKENCQKKFGIDYFIPQPAESINSSWNLFALSSDEFIGGFVDMSQNISVYEGFYKNKNFSRAKVYFLKGNNYLDIMKSNYILEYISHNLRY